MIRPVRQAIVAIWLMAGLWAVAASVLGAAYARNDAVLALMGVVAQIAAGVAFYVALEGYQRAVTRKVLLDTADELDDLRRRQGRDD